MNSTDMFGMLVVAFVAILAFVFFIASLIRRNQGRKSGPPAYDSAGVSTDWDRPEFNYHAQESHRYGKFAIVLAVIVGVILCALSGFIPL